MHCIHWIIPRDKAARHQEIAQLVTDFPDATELRAHNNALDQLGLFAPSRTTVLKKIDWSDQQRWANVTKVHRVRHLEPLASIKNVCGHCGQ